MKTATPLFALAPVALLAACATTSPDDGDAPGDGADTDMCDAEAASEYVGQKATARAGARIQAETGARQLRWGPPDSAWTMDFRPDRVNVRYDRAMTITEITCG